MLGFVPQGGADCHWQATSARVTSPSAFVILEVRASACGTSHSGQVIVLFVPEAPATTVVPTSHWSLVCCKCRLPPARLARSHQAASDRLVAMCCLSPAYGRGLGILRQGASRITVRICSLPNPSASADVPFPWNVERHGRQGRQG